MYGSGHGLGLCCAIEPESIKADSPTRAVIPSDPDPELIERERRAEPAVAFPLRLCSRL